VPFSGEMLHHYQILKLLGKGGMGEVYLARDTILDRMVAIKFLSATQQQDSQSRKRFLREAKAAAALNHPFGCQVFETGEVDNNAYIVMEYVTGETLKDRLARGPLPLMDALEKACEICEVLAKAHEKGIVHRDLKPANIMITEQGHPKIMDFGLAKQVVPLQSADSEGLTISGETLTEQGIVLGTVAYMSPEQARGEPVDARSDIFSFGMVLHEMLSGKNPFQRASQIDTLSAILRDASPQLKLEPVAAPSALSSILNKAMAKNVADRYQNIREMANDLRRLKEGLLPKKRPAWIWWALGGATVLVIALLAVVLWFAYRSPTSVPSVSHPPLSLLIADFTNKTGEAVFDDVLEKALEVGLEGAPFITSYRRPPARKIAQAIKPGGDPDRLDRAQALLVAQREGIHLVLAGTIEGSNSGYRIATQAINPFSGKEAASGAVKAKNKDDVLGKMAKLAVQIRKQLGDTEATASQSIARETFTASSLEAARRYAVAQDLIASGKNRQAIDAYQSALNLDPELGRAWAGLAAASANLNRYEDAKKYYQEAMKRIDRMTERELHRTLGGYYLRTGDAQAAIKELRTLVERYPADEAGLTNLAYANFLDRDMAAAMELGRKAVEIYPKNVLARGNLALYAMYAGSFDVAYTEAIKTIELNPGYETSYICQAVSELMRGHLLQAEEIYQKLAGVSVLGASLSVMGQADMALYQSKLAEGRSILELGVAGDISGSNPNSGPKLSALAGVQLLQGKTAEAIQAAARSVAISKEPRVLYEAANVYLDAGRINDALLLAKTLDANLEPDIQAYAHVIMAKARLHQGDREGGIRELEETQKNHDTWLGRYELGRAYLDAGKFPEAYTQLEQCLKRRGEATAVFFDDVPTVRYLPTVYYYLGRAQERLGSPAAIESYRTFLAIKEKGKGDPLVPDARRRLASHQ
jgi:eukaryotic-like serine/threonine-protein kinase